MCENCLKSDRDLEGEGWGSHAVERFRSTVNDEIDRGIHSQPHDVDCDCPECKELRS